MGREIRMVPKGWEHPKAKAGHYEPLYDRTHEEAARKWWEHAVAYHARDVKKLHEIECCILDDYERMFADYPWYWDWLGNPPDGDYYRAEHDGPADHCQMYETVSEGTPISPVFATKGELAQWMVDNLGYSEDAAAGFVEKGWAPSGVCCATGFHDGITGSFEPGICGKEKL